jgi:very-short-patch-repair endonuclease
MPRTTKDYNFGILHPELLVEWNFEKNSISPYEIAPKSDRVVNWKCKNCKECWDIQVHKRTYSKSGCPYCSGRRASKTNNLTITHPHIAKQWDYKKNKDRPEEYLYGSRAKKYFKCELEHSTLQQIGVKTRNRGECSICSKRRISNKNNLATEHPLVAAEWDYKKNKDRPEEFSSKSHAKRWFTCSKRNHSILVRIGGRTEEYNYLSCYECNRSTSKDEIYLFYELKLFFNFTEYDKKIKIKKGNNIEIIDVDIYLPEQKIVIEYDGYYWHKDSLQRDLKKNSKLLSRNIKVIRLREKPLNLVGKYSINVTSKKYKENANKLLNYLNNNFLNIDEDKLERYLKEKELQNKDEAIKKLNEIDMVSLRGLTNKNSLQNLYPTLINEEWDIKKNKEFRNPEFYSPNSQEVVWWICIECNNSYSQRIQTRVKNYRINRPSCKICRKKITSIGTNFPNLIKYWSKQNNLSPFEVAQSSNEYFYWNCNNGHTFPAMPSWKIKNIDSCLMCSKKLPSKEFNLVTEYPFIQKIWDFNKNNELPTSFLPQSHKLVYFICLKGNHSYKYKILERVLRKDNYSCYPCSKLTHI